MYTEWASLSSSIQQDSEDSQSALEKFTPGVRKNVTASIILQIALNLGISQSEEPSSLITNNDVHWCMKIICYCRTLPLTEHDTINKCVYIYCEWFLHQRLVPHVNFNIFKILIFNCNELFLII